MKISHKRKVQLKLQKQRYRMLNNVHFNFDSSSSVEKTVNQIESVVETKSETVTNVFTNISLTPKQQQVLDIIRQNNEGINPKSIGIAAGQDDAKAAAWATGALKKLVDEGLVNREQAGNRVSYTAV